MAHKLPRLSKSFLDSPQLIMASKFQEISEVLENREYLNSFKPEAFFGDDDKSDCEQEELVDDSVGVLSVEGPTTYKKTGWEALCGGCSYVGLLTQMNEFAEQGKKTVLMKIDSGGGQAYRMMYTSRELRRVADENGIRLIGYCDGTMASAGMGLGSSCHELIANPEAEVGSIGVVISLLDQSKALEKEGLKRVFVTAGGEKVPFNEDGSFRDSFLADLQDSVTDLYKKFTTHVATMRGMEVQSVRDTEARMFKADDALKLGLIDKVMEENEFYEYLESFSASTSKTIANLNTTLPEEILMSDNLQPEASVVDASAEMAAKLAEMQAAMDASTAQAEQLATQLAKYEAKETQAKKESLEASLSQFNFSNADAIVTSMMASAESETLVAGMLSEFTSQLTTLSAEHEEALATLNTSLEETKQEADLKVEEASKVAEAAKEEFAAPTLIEGDNTSLEDTEVEGKKSSALANFIKQNNNL